MLRLDNPLFQSPFLYLQAAGSDGSDGSSPGAHLRWDFRKMLKKNHLPKGNLGSTYPSSLPFNRANDFVNIYKAYWIRRPFQINFENPDRRFDTGSERLWEYDVSGTNNQKVILRFIDVNQHDQLKLVSGNKASDIFHGYNGVFELEVENQLFYRVEFSKIAKFDDTSSIGLETISLKDTGDRNDEFISCRHRILPPFRKDSVQCEHISVLRFRLKNVYVGTISIDTYEETILQLEEKQAWEKIGSFSLTLDDNIALNRLEDSSRFEIHGRWPKFNETDLASGEFTVNVANYQDRWQMADGLKEGVSKYLTLSQSDPNAIAVIPSDDGQSNTEFEYLAMLNFVSLDFHIARMLGLGYIDETAAQTEVERPFIYLAEYITESSLGLGYPAGIRSHYSMSLPTSIFDHRYPPVPVLKPVEYGLYYDNGSQQPSLISDPQGYVPVTNGTFEYVRFINLYREPFIYQNEMFDFFHNNELFCSCAESQTVLFGIEYKDQSEAAYRKPEILHDLNYKDPAGLPEVAPIPEHGEDKAIFVHEENTEGIHLYKLYSINWFSRSIGQSNAVSTDLTKFPIRNSLRPPANFAVQLIQPENPLIFTSGQEQVKLNGMVGDKTLVRVTFDWMDIHNIEYQYANKAELFFRENKPLSVQGKLTSIVNVANGMAEVQTGPLHVTSVTPNYTLHPAINAANVSRYVGSQISIGGTPHEVVQVLTTGNNPRIRIKRNVSTQVVDPDGDGVFIASDSFEDIPNNSNFILFEKITDAISWDFKLNKEVELVQFLPPHVEVVNHSDGTSTTQHVGGIFKPASITEVEDVYGPNDPAVITDPATAPFAGDPIAGSHTGVFNVKFLGFNLNDHPDADVDWYRGFIRIMEDASLFPATGHPNYRPPEMKKLVVAKIISLSPLEVVAVDADFDSSSSFANPKMEYMPIETGNNVDSNYHPGYKFYLEQETIGANVFDESNTLPEVGHGRKITYVGIRSKDDTLTPDIFSSISTPTPMLALEIQEPLAPGVPAGPLYANRPNFYGKANYTFDMEVDVTGGRQPYAMIFYRADHRKILNTLYSQTTVDSIINDLNNLSDADAAFSNNRWNDLVNMVLDGNQFKSYVPSGYRFPLPDNTNFLIPNVNVLIVDNPFDGARNFGDSFIKTLYIDPTGTPVTQNVAFSDIVKDAIDGAFLPLTEQPVLYRYIKQGFQTSSEKPKIRDTGGNIIFPSPGVPIDYNEFDPFPMVTRFDSGGTTKVRFTDYTLDGASTSIFFFFGVELSNRMEVSDSSEVAGPILLVNTMPAEEPAITKLESRTANTLTGAQTGVKLEVNPYIESEGIDKFQVFRATEFSKTSSVRSMNLVGEFELNEKLFDDFSDLNIPPYGEPLFYRVVALRKIKNEHDNDEWVPSKPSKVGLTNVIDTLNPPSPRLTYQSDPPAVSPLVDLTNVALEWSKTTHNGAYHLYKMTSKGNWQLIKSLRTNDEIMNVDLVSTYLNSGTLKKQDEDGNVTFNHFKVVAENASGMLSLKDEVITI